MAGAAGVLLALTGAMSLLRWARRRAQERARQRTHSPPSGIDLLMPLRLGGHEQWVQLRGHEAENPVLLIVHGGPGYPAMPFGHAHSALESRFIVVHWDQRESGRSVRWRATPLGIEEVVSDLMELVGWLRRERGAKRVHLLAHSWGTAAATLAVARFPACFHSYTGVGQISSLMASEEERYLLALQRAREAGDATVLRDLEKFRAAPYKTYRQYQLLDRAARTMARGRFQPVPPGRFLELAWSSPAYRWRDLFRIALGFGRWVRAFFRQRLHEVNLFPVVSRLEVPVTLLQGRHDVLLSPLVAERFFAQLEAPAGKRWVWFERSGHWLQFEEPEKYVAEMVHVAERSGQRETAGVKSEI